MPNYSARQKPDGFFVGGIQCLDDEVLDACFNELLIVKNGLLGSPRKDEAAPGAGERCSRPSGK